MHKADKKRETAIQRNSKSAIYTTEASRRELTF
jgi:hypothetical protein